MDDDDFGSLGGKTLLYYVITSAFAILIGITVVEIIQPGIVDGMPAKAISLILAVDRVLGRAVRQSMCSVIRAVRW